MREFILRARKGPTTPDFSLDQLSRHGRLEVVAGCMASTFFYSTDIRTAACLHIVLDGPSDPPKTVRLEGAGLGDLGGFDERALAGVLQRALAQGRGLSLGEEREADPGIFVSKLGFERIVQSRAKEASLYYLQRKGEDIRSVELGERPTFVFTDHLAMPKKTDKYMQRLGAKPISVGPRMLFASQCIVLVHNELDRRGLP
jgi:tRNA (pseudouridine54-N1)-methyltransferase